LKAVLLVVEMAESRVFVKDDHLVGKSEIDAAAMMVEWRVKLMAATTA